MHKRRRREKEEEFILNSFDSFVLMLKQFRECKVIANGTTNSGIKFKFND